MFKKLENCFIRAFLFSFSKKKILLTYPFVLLCLFTFIFAKSIEGISNSWISLAFVFAPIFFSFIVMHIIGIFLIQIYYSEVKNSKKFSYLDIFKKSFEKITDTFFITFSYVFIFLVLWVVLGLLIMINQMPIFGRFIGFFISFLPFLISLLLVLCVMMGILTLFFVLPDLSLKTKGKIKIFKDSFKNLKNNFFISIISFFIGIFTFSFVYYLLNIAFNITKAVFFISLKPFAYSIDSFFIIIFLSLFLTPFVIFFFNFSLETYNLINIKDKN